MRKLIYILIFSVLAVLLLLTINRYVGFPIRSPGASIPLPTPFKPKTFRSSSTLDFTIQIPADFEALERLGSVALTSPDGTIVINQNGTNFESLKDFIYESRNDLQTKLRDRMDLQINGLDSTTGFIDGEKFY